MIKEIKNEYGFLQYDFDDERAEIVIETIEVDLEHRCRGVGSSLISELKMIADELNLPIGLYAYPNDDSVTLEQLISFFEKNGFEVDRRNQSQVSDEVLIWYPINF